VIGLGALLCLLTGLIAWHSPRLLADRATHTIAGLGVRDGMLIWLLAIFGFRATGQAISLSICLLSISLFWAFAGGVAFFWPVSHVQAANRNTG